MNEPLVSIIIACKNNESYIEKSLQSVKDQTYKNWELIIVDNFSTDKTFEIAKKFTDKVYQKGPERSTQFNYGFTQSKGEYIYRIGAEFFLEKDVVEKCNKGMMLSPYIIEVLVRAFGHRFGIMKEKVIEMTQVLSLCAL